MSSDTGNGCSDPSHHADRNSVKAAAVVSAVNVLVTLVLMVFLWWAIIPSLERISRQGEEAIGRDKAQMEALDKAFKTSIRNQEKNRKLLEDVIKANRTQPKEER